MALKTSKELFSERPNINPTIYAYIEHNPHLAGLLKVGYTSTGDVKKRVAQQYPTKRPGKLPYTIVFEGSAMKNDGTSFDDHEVHRFLRKEGIKNPSGEWFECSIDEVQAAVMSIKAGRDYELERTQSYKMRPEQEEAVKRASNYFKRYKKDTKKTPHFLWNCKMRFGKTFASYQLAKKMDWKKVLVITFKPAVEDSWEKDLRQHVDFEGWQFFSKHNDLKYEDLNKRKPFVCFGSFQDFLGKNELGGIKPKNKWIHKTKWDCVILDEYHYGAWREKAKRFYDEEEFAEEEAEIDSQKEINEDDRVDTLEKIIPIKTGAYLYLSGTPFRALLSGEFIEEQVYHWTYSDEQKAKKNYKKKNNPYASLPKMFLLTYKLPDSISKIASGGEFDSFDLNAFFSAKGEGKEAKFIYENEVQKWLDLIRGDYLETTLDDLKLGPGKPLLPFSDTLLLNVLSHTFWYLPKVNSCHAMYNLLQQKQNRFYHDYKIIVAAGTDAGIGLAALNPVKDAMDDPLKTKTITLSCGKLNTGVTVKPWTGIFMLRNLNSPETYFQTAFRVQSPWTIKNPDGKSPNKEEIIKKECYVFDFAPDRALRQISEYGCNLNINEKTDPEKKVKEFIEFLPVLAYTGSEMVQIDAGGVLDMAMSGTTATLLARKWESALLVNVDNQTLEKLLRNERAMKALMSIEGFRNLNKDIETIINKSEAVKKAKKKLAEKENISEKEKRELTEEEKEYKSKRKEIQQKLIKFATRIPIFMYLTDYREKTLKDVITRLEPALFKKVTGLTVKDFELLVSLNLFNNTHMNAAVLGFRRYEIPSLIYAGITKHKGEDVGAYDIVVTEKEHLNGHTMIVL
ncbi:MAG: GIY-YIG nuclease family protein [Nanoarchaeota archaeon]|nr:GIY-YIG nuclease family protein [Nanoarchaeota archaeon]